MCHLRNVPLLYASSSCIHEWHKSPYGMSKKVNEETAFPGQVGLRFTTVYGDGARDSMFVGKLLRHELKFATDHIRDFIHVDDVIQAIELIMLKITDSHLFPETALQPAYDIGTGNGYAVSNVAKMLFPEVPIQTGDECEAQDNTADLTAINELGFKAKIDVLEYIAKNGKRYLYDFEL
jgi:nucleoside-diphosphate-sugar epimerase